MSEPQAIITDLHFDMSVVEITLQVITHNGLHVQNIPVNSIVNYAYHAIRKNLTIVSILLTLLI